MTLAALAVRIQDAEQSGHVWRVRVQLTNFVRGLESCPEERLACEACENGFKEALRAWLLEAGDGPVTLAELQQAMEQVLGSWPGRAQYMNTRNRVGSFRDHRAVTFVPAAVLPNWFPEDDLDASAAMAGDPIATVQCVDRLNAWTRVIAEQASDGTRHPDTGRYKVGHPRKAAWLTPLREEVKNSVDRALLLAARGTQPTEDDYGALADSVRSLMGMSHWVAGTPLVAAVTRLTIGELLGIPRASRKPQPPIMGPTVLESEAHPRWRHWAEDDYGRTFLLSPGAREDSGAPEAIRSPLPLEAFSQFIFVGQTTAQASMRDEQFARAIGADADVRVLLDQLHVLTDV